MHIDHAVVFHARRACLASRDSVHEEDEDFVCEHGSELAFLFGEQEISAKDPKHMPYIY